MPKLQLEGVGVLSSYKSGFMELLVPGQGPGFAGQNRFPEASTFVSQTPS